MRKLIFWLFLMGTVLFAQYTTKAAELITNGGFESGSFSGWTAVSPVGSFEPWSVSGTGSGWSDTPLPSSTQVIFGTRNAWNTVTSSPAGTHTLVQQVVLPAGQISILRWSHRYQMNLTTYCGTPAECGTATFRVEILNTSNVVLGTLHTVTTPSLSNTNTGWTSWVSNLSSLGGQTIRLRFLNTVTAPNGGPGKIEIDGVSIQSNVPTSAGVPVSGRVTRPDGQTGIGGVQISVVGQDGTVKTAITSPLGYYNIDGVDAGISYVVTATGKGRVFDNSPRLVSVGAESNIVDFTSSF